MHLFLRYTKTWWKFKDEKNVLLLHYKDAVSDMPKLIRQLAKFFDVSLSDSEVKKIAQLSHISAMKNMTGQVRWLHY